MRARLLQMPVPDTFKYKPGVYLEPDNVTHLHLPLVTTSNEQERDKFTKLNPTLAEKEVDKHTVIESIQPSSSNPLHSSEKTDRIQSSTNVHCCSMKNGNSTSKSGKVPHCSRKNVIQAVKIESSVQSPSSNDLHKNVNSGTEDVELPVNACPPSSMNNLAKTSKNLIVKLSSNKQTNVKAVQITKENTKECPHCNKLFKYSSGLSHHLKKEHGTLEKTSGTIQCRSCDKRYAVIA